MKKLLINFNLTEKFYFTKKNMFLIFFVLNLFFLYIVLTKFYDLKQKYSTSYLQLKEMSFLIENLYVKSIQKDELSVREFLNNAGYSIESIEQTENLLEIKFRSMDVYKMVNLSYILEENGFSISYFRASDNTGQGNFFVEIGVR